MVGKQDVRLRGFAFRMEPVRMGLWYQIVRYTDRGNNVKTKTTTDSPDVADGSGEEMGTEVNVMAVV